MRFLQVVLALGCMFALGCGDEDSGVPGRSASTVVTSEGGVVSLGDMTLAIPAGALNEDTRITVTVTEEATPKGFVPFSAVYRFQPEGLVFSKPATLTLPFNGEGEFAKVFWSRLSAAGYEQLDTVLNGTVVTAPVVHFSTGFVADGRVCSVTDNGDGTKTITCTDGTSVTLNDGTDGEDGTSCTVTDNSDGTKTIACTDGTSVTVADGTDGVDGTDGTNGTDGENGTSCTVTDNGDGTKTISCTDGTSVTVADGTNGVDGTDGEDGTSCTVTDNSDGTKTIACTDGTSVTVADGTDGVDGTDGTNGTDGVDGSSCTVTENGDGTKTIACTDGTSVTVADGTDGVDGTDGTSCSVTDNGDGTKTIVCTDGTSVTVSDGTDGESCTLVDNGDGTSTLTCPDGTSVTFSTGTTTSTVLQGSYRIDNSMDVAFLQDFEEITGNLIIDATGLLSLSLPRLARIGGTLFVVGTTVQEIDLPNLVSIGTHLEVAAASLTSIVLPALSHVGGVISVTGGTLDAIDFPVLVACGGLEVSQVPLTLGLHLPLLANVGSLLLIEQTGLDSLVFENLLAAGQLTIILNDQLGSVSAPGLESIGATLTLQGINLSVMDFPALTSVGDLVIHDLGSPSFEIPSLRYAGGVRIETLYAFGQFQQWEGALQEVHLPSVEGSLHHLFVAETGLVALRLPGVSGIDGLAIISNPDLAIVDLAGLATLDDTGLFGEVGFYGPGHHRIDGNISLQVLSLPLLTSVTGDLVIANNGLVSVQLPQLLTISGGLAVEWELMLQHMDLDSLQRVGPVLDAMAVIGGATLAFYENPHLLSMSLASLEAVDGDFLWVQWDQVSQQSKIEMPMLSTVSGHFRLQDEIMPRCLVEAILDHVVVSGSVDILGRDDCTCAGDPLVATCCNPDYLVCCGSYLCWVDTCGNEGSPFVDCPLGCVDGACVCPEGEVPCSGACTTLGTDSNCSACGDSCGENSTCQDGECSCPEGEVSCFGVCTTLGTDSNCSACGDSCDENSACQDGACSCFCDLAFECARLAFTECGPLCAEVDGQTASYPDLCALKVAAGCAADYEEGILAFGACPQPTCDACLGMPYSPVCGSNGKTYRNQCELVNAQACFGDIGVTRACLGACTTDTCTVCPDTCAPVCGDDNLTYMNECAATTCGSLAKEVAYNGACCPECDAQPTNPVCTTAGNLYRHSCYAICHGESLCPTTGTMVCGLDGLTYVNACEADCRAGGVLHEGACL